MNYDREYNEIQGDLLDEYQAIQAMELPMEDEPEMATDEEIKRILGEMMNELIPPSVDEEYTERDAFDDFIADQHEDWN